MTERIWSPVKSQRLRKIRGVSFEELVKEKLVAVRSHPKRENQQILLFARKGYIWVVPFVEVGGKTFLKTLYPSRKWTKKYQRGEL